MRIRWSDLAGAAGRGVRVALVDSGVAADHPHVGPIAGGVGLSDGPAGVAASSDFSDRLGHGTSCAGILHLAAAEAEILAVRIFDTELKASARLLARAIDWAVARGADIVNLSVGTTDPTAEELLAPACWAVLDAGGIVVAAAGEPGCLPARLPGVVSVAADSSCGPGEVAFLPAGAAARLAAHPLARPAPGRPPERNYRGASQAAACATGLLALAREIWPAATFEEIAARLAERQRR